MGKRIPDLLKFTVTTVDDTDAGVTAVVLAAGKYSRLTILSHN